DAANLTVSISVADAENESPENSLFQAGETGTVTVIATFDDYKDGSETHTVTVWMPLGFSYASGTITGLPTGATFDDTNPTKIVFTVPSEGANGTGSFSVTLAVTNDGADDGVAQFEVEARAE